MRRKFNLDITGDSLERAMILIHGGYAAGKTFLLADFLRHFAERGKVRFLNVIGEDGYMSAGTLGLGDVGETVDTYEDMSKALEEYKQEGLLALGVDSLKPASKLAMAHILGTDARMPTVGGNRNEWGEVHFAMENLTNRMRAVCPWVMCVCPSDKSVNQIDGKTYITPDLPGREAAGSAGWFDFVGYIQSEVVSGGKVLRKVKFAPNTTILTRQRLPRPITEDVTLPEGRGGWQKILEVINRTMQAPGGISNATTGALKPGLSGPPQKT